VGFFRALLIPLATLCVLFLSHRLECGGRAVRAVMPGRCETRPEPFRAFPQQ
jgi:hypothetical protein